MVRGGRGFFYFFLLLLSAASFFSGSFRIGSASTINSYRSLSQIPVFTIATH
jgi:hypothetical protein